MPDPHAKSNKAVAERILPVDLRTWLVLAGIVALAALLRGVRLGEAPGGFHVFNEAFYIDLATRMMRQPAFAWFLHPLDVNNPPLYPVLVSWLYRLGAPELAGARVISVLAGTWSVFVTFLLGRLLYDERTGIIAAALLAVMPGAVLVDHNIQVDPLFVALLLTSLYLYVLAARTGSAISAFGGGAVLGLAFLTKQPAILAVPALAVWETWCTGNVRWLRKGRVWRFAAGFALLGVPWYVAQIGMNNISTMFTNAASIHANSPLAGGSDFWSSALVGELAWMLFPVTGLLAVCGLGYAIWKRHAGDKLLLVLTATYVAWYVVFHQHSYYLLPLAPLLALAASRFCTGLLAEKMRWPWVRAGILGLLLAVMVFASVLMLGGQKWGRWSPMTYVRRPDVGFNAVRLYSDSQTYGLFGPAMTQMPRELDATYAPLPEFLDAPQVGGTENLFIGETYLNSERQVVPPHEPVMETWLRPVLFGQAIGQMTPEDSNHLHLHASQVFMNAPWTAEPVGPWWVFGLQSVPVKSGLYIYDKASFGG